MVGGFGKWKDEGREWKMPVLLTADQRTRYQRHLLLPEVGVAGQAKLLDTRVLLLGAGGLGSPAALYLAPPGVGTLGIVEWTTSMSGTSSARSCTTSSGWARARSTRPKDPHRAQPRRNVVDYDARLSADNILDIIKGYDLIVDGADNFPAGTC